MSDIKINYNLLPMKYTANLISKFSPQNKMNFEQLVLEKIKLQLYDNIINHILSHKEDEYYTIEDFISEYRYDKYKKKIMNMIPLVCEKLKTLGWQTAISYGGTGLFIYEKDKPPNCYEDI